EVGNVLELHEELLSSREALARRGWGDCDGDVLAACELVDRVRERDVPPGALGGDVVAVEVTWGIPPGLFPDRGDTSSDRCDSFRVSLGAAFEGVVIHVPLRATRVPGAILHVGQDRDTATLDHLVGAGLVVAVPVRDKP